MGRYLDALRKIEKCQPGNLKNQNNLPRDFPEVHYEKPNKPKQPANDGFLGSLGSVDGTLEKKQAQEGSEVADQGKGGFLGLFGTAHGAFENIHPSEPVNFLTTFPDALDAPSAVNDHYPTVHYSLPTSPDADDRIRCTECGNLTFSSVCSIARPGGIVSAMRGYRPAGSEMLQRCAGYAAKPVKGSEND